MRRFFVSLLARCARFYIARTKPYIIWVTWSVGKTTSRLIITQLLRQQLPTLRIDTSEKNFNSEIWLCLAILWIRAYEPTFFSTLRTIFFAVFYSLFAPSRADVFVLEYWIDHPWDMDELLAITKPHMWILTGIDTVHAAYFPTPQDIFTEKVKLLDATSDIVFYAASLHTYFEDHYLEGDVLSFALHEDENETDIGFNAYAYWRVDETVWSEFIVCEGEDRMVKIRTNLVWHEHAWYLSLAYEIAQIIAVRKNLYFPVEQNIDVSVDLQPWRMHRFAWKWWSILLDSSYNASPGSMRMLIGLLTDIRQQLFPERKLVFCLGEMRELWNESKFSHEWLAKQILHADRLFLIWQDIHDYLLPELFVLWYAPDRVTWFSDAISLWNALDTYLSEQQELSLVLFKWSQNTIFLEEAVKQVLRFPDDAKKLCRQWHRRLQKKSK